MGLEGSHELANVIEGIGDVRIVVVEAGEGEAIESPLKGARDRGVEGTGRLRHHERRLHAGVGGGSEELCGILDPELAEDACRRAHENTEVVANEMAGGSDERGLIVTDGQGLCPHLERQGLREGDEGSTRADRERRLGEGVDPERRRRDGQERRQREDRRPAGLGGTQWLDADAGARVRDELAGAKDAGAGKLVGTLCETVRRGTQPDEIALGTNIGARSPGDTGDERVEVVGGRGIAPGRQVERVGGAVESDRKRKGAGFLTNHALPEPRRRPHEASPTAASLSGATSWVRGSTRVNHCRSGSSSDSHPEAADNRS